MRKANTINIIARMSYLVKPLFAYMLFAIFLGVAGFLCAIFIPYLAVLTLAHIGIVVDFPVHVFFVILIVLAVLRGILHYGEQACNHYIAFKILAIIRDKVFTSLRRLAPAKLEGRDKGDLITLITSDIEALEVFYAHTISPVCIAIITSSILLALFWDMHIAFFMIGLIAYVFVGFIIPFIITKKGGLEGDLAREKTSVLSSYTLASLRGIQEILQYNVGEDRLAEMHKQSVSLNDSQKELKRKEGWSGYIANGAILIFSLLMFLVGTYLYQADHISFTSLLLATVLMLSSFGPVIALSNLSNTLLLTMASARRVLSLLDEEEIIKEIKGQEAVQFEDIQLDNVSFAYDEEAIVNELKATFQKGKITGVLGKSGSGKSTLMKLMMRFWDIDKGIIQIGERSLSSINTLDLRIIQSYVTQDTVLFHDTILNNLRIAKLDATPDEIEAACRKASIHEFIISLPKQYQTKVEELGDSLSGGEKQRIGIARAFLHDADCILLDEPTSNLDALNEAVILKSLQKQTDKTIVIATHRTSTMKIAHHVICMENGRVS